MTRIGIVDLEILHLGVKNNGTFNETDLEKSDIKRLGVGRILDALASLKDRKMIEMNKDGSFSVTELAKNHLWSKTIPSWLRILRLLEIKSFSENEIFEIMGLDKKSMYDDLEKLRAGQLVMMSPQRKNNALEKIYEILPEGSEKIRAIEVEGYQNITIDKNNSSQSVEVLKILEQVIQDVSKLNVEEKIKNDIISKIKQVREKIQI